MKDIILEIKNELIEILDRQDDFTTKVNKILNELRKKKIQVTSTYCLKEFKEVYSIVEFTVKSQYLENIDSCNVSFVVHNKNFAEKILELSRKALELYIVQKFNINPVINVSKSESKGNGLATNKQIELLKDKMSKHSEMIKSHLREFEVEDFEQLTKEEASEIITALPRQRRRRY